MTQIARNETVQEWGFLKPGHSLIHDRDGKYCPAFQDIIDNADVQRGPFLEMQPANDREGSIQCHERLGGLLKLYDREAA